MGRIDRSKANIKAKGFRFVPFRPTERHAQALGSAGLQPNRNLLVFEREGTRRAVTLHDATYHHVIQGTLAGQPYLVSF